MGLFGGKKQKTFLGVDIGASGVKVVELSNAHGRVQLMTYGYAELPPSGGGDALFDRTKDAGVLLAKVCKKADTKSLKAMAALPTSHIFSTILLLPQMKDEKQMKPLIDAEVTKLTPLPLAEMITYSTFLDKKEESKDEKKKKKDTKAEPVKNVGDKKNHVRVMVTGAAKTLVQKYIEIFKSAKLELQAIDTESFALIRSLIGKDKSSIMILDMGSKRTNIIISEKGIPYVSRSVNVGGDAITTQIKNQMSMEDVEAERIKRDFAQMQGQGSDLAGGLPKLLESFVQPLVNEIRYALQLYASMDLTEGTTVEKIILTGGSSNLPRVAEFLSETLNVNVYRGDPWARVAYPKDLASVLEEIGPRMGVAIGLAMREME